MVGKRVPVTIKIPNTTLAQMDAKINCGNYCDRTDLILQAIWYLIHKEELRDGLKAEVLQDLDMLLTERLYSDENTKFPHKISEDVADRVTKKNGGK